MSTRAPRFGPAVKLVLFLSVLASPALAAPASAYLYWSDTQSDSLASRASLGRANLNGTGVDASFFPADLANDALGAVTVAGGKIYWSPFFSGRISRMNSDGTGLEQNFIDAPSLNGIAVDSAHVYWSSSGFQRIGRADADGGNVDESFIKLNDQDDATVPSGVAVDAAHLYWGEDRAAGPDTIGRANLDGSAVDRTFITGASDPKAVAVDGQHIYWTNDFDGTIGRANLDGTGVEHAFITGGANPHGIAVDSRYLYWANFGSRAIGRANLDGSGVDQRFIETGVYYLAVDGLPSDATRPETTITRGPPNRIRALAASVRFKFKSSEPSSAFECALDKDAFERCSSPYKTNAKRGRHRFQVRAIDPSNNVDTSPAGDRFKVVR